MEDNKYFGSLLGIVFSSVMILSGCSNYNVNSAHSVGKDKVENISINAKNTSVNVNSRNYDEGVVQYAGNNFNKLFKSRIENGTLYIEKTSEDKAEMEIVLPQDYKNDVNLDIKSTNGNVAFNGTIKVKDISCKVENGDITGDTVEADKADLKTDSNHKVSIKNFDAKEKEIN